MFSSIRGSFAFLFLIPAVLVVMGLEAAQPSKTLQIGIANTFIKDQPKALVGIATSDFEKIMSETTGMKGGINSKYDALGVGEKLNNKEFHFGFLQGHELAWVNKKFPAIRPLVIAADKHGDERAYLIVHKDGGIKSCADLRGKKLAISVGAKGHCQVFLEKICQAEAEKGMAEFFGAITKAPTAGDALDAVARKKADATVIDRCALEFYQEIKGAVFTKNLNLLRESEAFPHAAIVYKEGGIDEATLTRFRDGLLKAHTNEHGRAIMKTWNMEAFEAVPKDYTQKLAEVLKAYPAPVAVVEKN